MKKKLVTKKSRLRLCFAVFSKFLPVVLVILGTVMVIANAFSPRPNRINERIDATQGKSSIESPIPTQSPTPITEISSTNEGYCLNVPVIYYHHIQPLAEARAKDQKSLTVDNKTFDSQMAYLTSKGYSSLSADQLVIALITKSKLPVKPIVITVDDGYADFYTYAYPTFKKYHLVANLAIPAGLLDKSGHMNWDQLNQLVESKIIFVYNHTWSHVNLTSLSPEKVQDEVFRGKEQLQKHSGKFSNVFFYPYGATNKDVISVLSKNGYQAGFTTDPGFIQCDSYLMNLRRTGIGNSPMDSYGL